MPTKMAFEPSSTENNQPIKPTFIVNHIGRGEDDGNHGSCSDPGVISLKSNETPPLKQGYIFEIAEGEFEDSLFDETPVIINNLIEDKRTYSFIWFDRNSDEQEPFNIRVKITAVSNSGHKSTPQYFVIKHPGIEKPWWKIW